jgi:Trypsin
MGLALAGASLAFVPTVGATQLQLVHPAIVGGNQIAIGQAPWQVAVQAVIPEGNGFVSVLCGGSIIDSAHVLTAAHCVFDSKTGNAIPAEDFTVSAGTSDLASDAGPEEQERAVTDVRPHPYYVYAPDSGQVGPDDVAVLTLQEPLVLGPAATVIPLVSPGESPAEGTSVNLTGFGEENPLTDELNGRLYSLGMTVGWPRECGGENDAVLICASSVSGTPCNGDSGGALTLGSPAVQVGVEDDLFLVSGKRCVAGAENAFANVAAPEIQDFIDGSEEPPRAPRGGHAVIREAPINDGVMSCEPGTWNGNPTYTYTFLDTTDGQVLQQGAVTTYAVPVAEVGHLISCEVQASNAGGVGMGRTPGLVATAAAPVPQQPPAAAGGTTPPSPPPTGHLSLAGTRITVQSSGMALVKLECVGEATCDGKLTLTARVTVKAKGGHKAGKHTAITRTVTIGTVSFSTAGDETTTVKVNLDTAGRALLGADHGRCGASLALAELAPGRQNTQTKTVQLVQQKTRGKTKK